MSEYIAIPARRQHPQTGGQAFSSSSSSSSLFSSFPETPQTSSSSSSPSIRSNSTTSSRPSHDRRQSLLSESSLSGGRATGHHRIVTKELNPNCGADLMTTKGSSISKQEHTVINVGHPDGPPRLISCVKASQGFDWNQEIFLPSYADHESSSLERRKDPVHEIVLTDAEVKALFPQ